MISKVLSLGIISVLGILIFLSTPILASSQSNPTQTALNYTPTSTPSAVPSVPVSNTAISTQAPSSQLSTDQMIDLYKEAIEVSKNTVEDVHATTNNVLTAVTVLLTAFTFMATGVAWLTTTFISNSTDQLKSARDQLRDTQSRYETRTEDFEKRNEATLKSFDGLVQKQVNLLEKIENAEDLLKQLQSEISIIKTSGEGDRQVLKRPLIMVLIDDYEMQMLSGNQDEKENSIRALVEISMRSDAVVRRRAVEALGLIDDYDERAIERLKEIVSSDTAQGVRKEAEKSLKLIEAKKPKKTTRRKS